MSAAGLEGPSGGRSGLWPGGGILPAYPSDVGRRPHRKAAGNSRLGLRCSLWGALPRNFPAVRIETYAHLFA